MMYSKGNKMLKVGGMDFTAIDDIINEITLGNRNNFVKYKFEEKLNWSYKKSIIVELVVDIIFWFPNMDVSRPSRKLFYSGAERAIIWAFPYWLKGQVVWLEIQVHSSNKITTYMMNYFMISIMVVLKGLLAKQNFK